MSHPLWQNAGMKHEEGRVKDAEARMQESEVSRDNKAAGALGTRRDVPAWWLEVPDAEKAVIRDVLTSIRGLKGSRSPQVGQAARKWERSIACFIRFRLIGEKQKTESRKLRWEHPVVESAVSREKAQRAKG